MRETSAGPVVASCASAFTAWMADALAHIMSPFGIKRVSRPLAESLEAK